MNRLLKLIMISNVLFFTVYSSLSDAATRRVCFQLKFADSRTDCPSTATAGARRGCNTTGSYSDMVGHYIEAWDKDGGDGSDDEYIGLWYLTGGGTQCLTFEWENANYSKGEANPDVYLKYVNKVRATSGSSKIVEAKNHAGNAHNKTSWRNGSGSNSNLYVATNCQTGSSCRIYPAGAMAPTTNAATQRAKRIMALDSVQHALQVYGSIMEHNVDMRYPCDPNGCGSSRAISQTVFDIDDDSSVTSGKVAPHELGHVLQMQLFNQNKLRDDCSRNGSGHGMTTIEWESCATTEGWANYVAAVSWYNPGNSASSPVGWGVNFETASPVFTNSCTNTAHTELAVARAFWDLDDANNEAGVTPASGDDEKNSSTTFIANGWKRFDNGTGNGDDYESGRDGVNVRDYYRNNSGYFSGQFFETLVEHNCLEAQTNG
ncbi:hypothetical protein [Pleionea sediminis]|uniref:hypothetical protein n=1 Tax=Pleionea sediminis TaxID=2569479 RepID=UPI0011858917|nr:hypothetical protein [Pleionea sediminis]